ncbi:hypothetical protein L486_02610 [Kwoniella mangroviensis CBS 10435]|uniref:Uncharacterized protein n=1 Tax=Kwoniella mangroviensis CBS 10435 TaxID=1331196 RepID=A0A1B9IWM3_9TREE|nr:uncharacterized protein I203_01552 [Kwoniella mangroviensis CBS 8507]OCF59937.1 hypothetical protein L486_02610 [Kwoniella mangroviensis CBS 10435]OCF69688.1 hypothetical protein I203_01552 [Kwoniella mangroviensis CBS 8507]OCF70908.1 hypothetical protein I204_08458 [Kwoniella mangroviensis CBS 8886]
MSTVSCPASTSFSMASLDAPQETPGSFEFTPTMMSTSTFSSSPSPSIIYGPTHHSSFGAGFDIDKEAVEVRESQLIMDYNRRRYPNSNRDLALTLGYKLCTGYTNRDGSGESDNPFKIKVEPVMNINWDRLIQDIPFGDQGRTQGPCGVQEVQELMDQEEVYECKGKVMMRRTERSKGKTRSDTKVPEPKNLGKVNRKTQKHTNRKSRNTATESQNKRKARLATYPADYPFHTHQLGNGKYDSPEPFFEPSYTDCAPKSVNKRSSSKSSRTSTDSDKTLVENDSQPKTLQGIVLYKIQNVNIQLVPTYHYARTTLKKAIPLSNSSSSSSLITNDDLDREHQQRKVERAKAKRQEREKIRGNFPDLALGAMDMYVKNYGEEVGMERFARWLLFEKEFYEVEYTLEMAIEERRRRSTWYRRMLW